MFISRPLRNMVFADILVTMTSALDCDVLVAGGGPAGLAIAIAARMNGLSAIVIERQPSPPDKACGECLMPAGGISAQPAGRAGFNRSRPSRFDRRHSIQTRRRCVGRGPTTITGRTGRQENRADCSDDASSAPTRRGNSPAHQRTRLSCPAGPCACRNGCGPVRARFLAAADGLHSRLRSMAGLQATSSGPRRFGIRQHFRVKPWCRYVEIHFTDGVEAYVTPVGPLRVGVAFLWDDARVARQGASIDKLFERFPSISVRLAGAEVDSRPRGAGPMARTARSRIADRFALVGDAAGYIDAITGEGCHSRSFRRLPLAGYFPPRSH